MDISERLSKILHTICYEHFSCDDPDCLQRQVNLEALAELEALVADEPLTMLERLATLADKEYTWQEVDNWTFSFGCLVRDELIRRRQAALSNTKGEEK